MIMCCFVVEYIYQITSSDPLRMKRTELINRQKYSDHTLGNLRTLSRFIMSMFRHEKCSTVSGSDKLSIVVNEYVNLCVRMWPELYLCRRIKSPRLIRMHIKIRMPTQPWPRACTHIRAGHRAGRTLRWLAGWYVIFSFSEAQRSRAFQLAGAQTH